MSTRAPETWGQYVVYSLRTHPRAPIFALAVLTLVVVISARFLLVTGFPRTATADPARAGAARAAPTGARPATPISAQPAPAKKPLAPGATGAGTP